MKVRASTFASRDEVRILPVLGIPDVMPDDSITDLLLAALSRNRLPLRKGDILVVKHKVVSKAECRTTRLDSIKPSARARRFADTNHLDARVVELALRQASRIVRRKHVLITETRHGLVCANSGVDVSNVDGGKTAVLLPLQPDQSAGRIHRELKRRTRLHIPVIVSDSFGRAWREGLTEVAIGAAGMKVRRDYRGKRDVYGYVMHATEEAVADELACAAGLVCGKDLRIPACIIRGYRYQRGGGGASRLIRPAAKDLFR